jgi:hypothetical protein
MSTIGAVVNAVSQVNALRSTSGADALDSIVQMFSGATGQSPTLPPAASGGSTPVSTFNAFDPSTFNALLSIQEKANGGVAQAADALGGSDGQDGSDSSEPTMSSVTNPDGSTTTTLTYADGTQEVTTTPPVQPVAAAATDMATDAISKNLDQLGDLLGPIATAALFAL